MTTGNTDPKHFLGITISSTFTDLQEHRAALIKIISANGLKPIAMEDDAAKNMDVIDSSIGMVREGSAYIGIIAKKYGQTPEDQIRNPKELSITELEYNEAFELGRPILLFIMGDDHLGKAKDFETDPNMIQKLEAFKERAKIIRESAKVHRVYAIFNSLEEFKEKAAHSVSALKLYLEEQKATTNTKKKVNRKEVSPNSSYNTVLPFHAEPPYIGSHKFVGRQSQLEELNDWVKPADPHTILLFEAIGGNGKSMLTWEWATKHAGTLRTDWAGIFWYSFYEKGAIMASFCRYAIAYITQQPVEAFKKKKSKELAGMLLEHLKSRPWLLILDGLERVLVAYNRIDAAEVREEELDEPEDKIAHRNPCSCINAEDDDLLRLLSAATPSKILITTRLVPQALINSAGQAIPGVLRVPLKGLRPTDAEALFRACDITGDSLTMQAYLTTNCDCHPLTIGVLAGLINHYLPDKGNFDAWAADANGGGKLNLANLNLVQKRNHILKAAFEGLPPESLELLYTLALLSEAADYAMLTGFNPHLPKGPEVVEEPEKPEDSWHWEIMTEEEKEESRSEYKDEYLLWIQYQEDVKKWQNSAAYLDAPKELEKTVHDLEVRGLLQYDANIKRYDLHPVVRGVASGTLQENEKEEYGQRVVDFFTAQTHNPYEQAETLEDLRIGINLVRILLKMGHYDEAWDAYDSDLLIALLFNLEAYKQVLALTKAFFPNGWNIPHSELTEDYKSYLIHSAAVSLQSIGELNASLEVYNKCIFLDIAIDDILNMVMSIGNISTNLLSLGRLADAVRVGELVLLLAELSGSIELTFTARLDVFTNYLNLGKWQAAEEMWAKLDPMGRDWSRNFYRSGMAEEEYAKFYFYRGNLDENILSNAERLSKVGKNRSGIRYLSKLRGKWQLEKRNIQMAIESFQKAVQMARAIDSTDEDAETWLVLAKQYSGELTETAMDVERLEKYNKPAFQPLAELWLALGNTDKAKFYALKAYEEAWADGEPYVYRYSLNKAIELLNRLGEPIPTLPPYDPSKDQKLPWEDKVNEIIEKLKKEKKKKAVVKKR